MKVETLLPLAKVDPKIPARISDEVQNLYATVGI